MPGALVPASRSSQLLPSTKPMCSARRSTLGVPQTQSSWPEASETAMTASQSRAAWPEHVVEQREDPRQRVRLAVVAQRIGGQRDRAPRRVSTSTPAAAERTQESATWARTPPLSSDSGVLAS